MTRLTTTSDSGISARLLQQLAGNPPLKVLQVKEENHPRRLLESQRQARAKAERLRLERNQPLPPLPTTEQRIERLRDARYIRDRAYVEAWWQWGMAEGPCAQVLHDFLVAYRRAAERRAIPILPTYIDGFGGLCRVEHAQLGLRLRSEDWAILERIGTIAASCCAGRFRSQPPAPANGNQYGCWATPVGLPF